MKINKFALCTGDIVYTRGFNLTSLTIRAVTKSPVSHVGIYFKLGNVGRIAEMVGDFKFDKLESDLELNLINKYEFYPWNYVYSVRRNYRIANDIQFQNDLIQKIWGFYKTGIPYDFQEVFCHLFKDTKDKRPKFKICSGFVYEIYKSLGYVWSPSIDPAVVGYAPSPGGLYTDPHLKEVKGWKL